MSSSSLPAFAISVILLRIPLCVVKAAMVKRERALSICDVF